MPIETSSPKAIKDAWTKLDGLITEAQAWDEPVWAQNLSSSQLYTIKRNKRKLKNSEYKNQCPCQSHIWLSDWALFRVIKFIPNDQVGRMGSHQG